MKILLTWRICGVGGVETWMTAVARTLRGMGHDCHMFFFQHGEFEKHIPPEIPVHFGELEDFARLVSEGEFEIVHGINWDWEMGISISRPLGARLVVHGQGWAYPFWHSRNCDVMVACSRWNARAQQALSDLSVQPVLNGIDISRFPAFGGKIQGPPIIAWVGRGSDVNQKRINKLAEIAPHLKRAGLRLWIADPEREQVLPEYAQVLAPLAERWGRVAPGDMCRFYQDVAASGGCKLSTARFEGQSLACIEAQACGCPVVGPDVRGVNESLDVNQGGVLFPDETPAEKVAELLVRTVGDTEKMAWRRAASRRFVEENCTLEKVVAGYLAAYKSPKRRSIFSGRAIRSRMRFSPLFQWNAYLEGRWKMGRKVYALAEKFDAQGETRLADAAVRTAFEMAPTIFLRGHRLKRLMRAKRGGAANPGTGGRSERMAEKSAADKELVEVG